MCQPHDLLPEPGAQSKLASLEEEVAKEAMETIKKILPAKIQELTRLLGEKNGYEQHLTPKMGDKRSHTQTLEIIQVISQEYELFKAAVLELVQSCFRIKIWLQLLIPRIEDGNNFGVGIQEEVVGQLGKAEDSGLIAIDAMGKFFLQRAKLLGKAAKYGALSAEAGEAYGKALKEADRKQLYGLWVGWIDLRNNYLVLYDLIMKNLEKLLAPRSTNATNMY